jgi:BirA family biotin operon repressor/biotin-[acetyl-CoA-carboxylase] ligase
LYFNKNQPIGSNYLHFKSIPSTHDYATELLTNGSPIHGTVISADFQEAGKGQHGKSWFSDTGKNILASIILFPDNLPPSKLFLMNMTVCLAVRKTILAFFNLPATVQIKWPNDIFVCNKKIAGILTKNNLSFQKVQNTIISVGINVNQSYFPAELPNATSLFLTTGHELEKKIVELALFSHLEEYLSQLAFDETLIKTQYHDCLWGLHQERSFLDIKNNNELKGSISGVSQQGELILITGTEKEEFHFQHGELIYL